MILAFMLAVLLPCAVWADATDSPVSIELLPGWRTDEGTHIAAFRIKLDPGWKTYWRAPGDAGIPPRIDWSGSRNIDSVALHWPVPEIFSVGDMRSIGYHDEVVIPLEFVLSDAGNPAHLAGTIEIGVCDDICVPFSASFDAALPLAGGRSPMIVAALIDQPLTAHEAGVTVVTCTISAQASGLHIAAAITMPNAGPHAGDAEAVVIETGDPAVWVSEPQSERRGDVLFATADLSHMAGGAFALDRAALRFTVLGDNRAVDIRGCVGG